MAIRDVIDGPRSGRERSLPGRCAVAVLLVAAWALTGPRASAGDYHTGTTLLCSQCHVMHFSQQHGYDPFGGPFQPLGVGPNRALLRNRINDLCLSCHDGSTLATDVLGSANTGSQVGIVRSGGYLNRLGITALPETGHTLDSIETAPGSQPLWKPEDENGAGQGLTCINCHAPHGTPSAGHPTGAQYRNLRDDPGGEIDRWVTYNGTQGVNDLSRDVFVRQFASYDESDLDWNEPNPTDSANARWCGGCHTVVHGNALGSSGGSGGAGGFLGEHPVWDEDLDTEQLDQYNPKANKVKVMSEIGFWSPAGSDVTPTCLTCHKAHGNGNPDGLIFRSGTGILTEDGDSNGTSVEDLCMQCHVEGSAFSGLAAPGSTPTAF